MRPRKRKIKCRDCIYYNENSNTCESKKVATSGNHSKVTWLDRLLCEPRSIAEEMLDLFYANKHLAEKIKSREEGAEE